MVGDHGSATYYAAALGRDELDPASPLHAFGAACPTLPLMCVGAFVAVGRNSHEDASSLVEFLGTTWPFAAALAVA
ncbi:DUF3054 family protein [Nocardiopsis chromatogenes]|uniref:DUF3054 family protein n=1 Tax=Nocardiopsis chromatogenes TaxID=280239 RepID=UPI0003457CB6|nr:DUF3054 family protein [Nocardiopsis chromatogenes]